MFAAKDLIGTKGGYKIGRSLRFRSSASAYLSRTPASAGNRKTFTISFWTKRGDISTTSQYIFGAGTGTTEATWFAVAIDTATTGQQIGSTSWTTTGGYTNATLRDPSAWYHIVLAIDTTQATAANRSKLYINGVLQSYTGAVGFTQNADLAWNNNVLHYIGARLDSGPRMYYDGYMADLYNIDGQALTPSSFGETDATTGVWKPKAYTGTYGTNGFYLKFTDVGSTTAGGANTGYGKDFAGTNNWTTNNFGTTSTATTYDSMIDTPTPYTTDGVYNVGNYATLNPLAVVTGSTPTLSNGNLTTVTGVAGAGYSMATIALPSSGKYYWETGASSTAGGMLNGIAPYSTTMNAFTGTACSYYSDGTKYVNGVNSAYGSAYTTNTIGIAVDIDSGTVTFYRDNVSQGAITYAGANLFAFVSDGSSSNSSTFDVNFGQRPFTYTPPSGFKALNTQNLPTPTIAAGNAYMDISLWTGNQNARTITNSGAFQPDLIWTKSRSDAESHRLHDAVRGGNGTVLYELNSNTTDAEGTDTLVSGFAADGFTIAAGANSPNITSRTYIGWQWKANGSSSSNTSGSITSTVSANTTAGFSVVTYTGTGANATVGHGLGVAPSMIIVKNRDVNWSWRVYHSSLANTQILYLDATSAAVTDATAWNSASPTSSVFSVGTSGGVNESTKKLVAYCFAAVAGYSAFGSYTGNGSADGPFVFLGFRPRYIMLKVTSGAGGNWFIRDTARDPYNTTSLTLYPNLSDAEFNATGNTIDILSNGFKLRSSSSGANGSGETIIYAAFAENPFKYALAR